MKLPVIIRSVFSLKTSLWDELVPFCSACIDSKVLVWAQRHEKGCVALSASPAWATHLGMRHSSALAPARIETSLCHSYIAFTHAGLSADKNKSPPWVTCAWLTNCTIAQASRSCGKPRCTEACLRRVLTPLSSQRGSRRNSGHKVVSAELGQHEHSVVPRPPAPSCSATSSSLPGCQLPTHHCTKQHCRDFEENSWSKVVVVEHGMGAGDRSSV